MKINRYNWHKWAFAAWFVVCGLVGIALSVAAIIFLTSLAWGHPEEPKPKPDNAIIEFLKEKDCLGRWLWSGFDRKCTEDATDLFLAMHTYTKRP